MALACQQHHLLGVGAGRLGALTRDLRSWRPAFRPYVRRQSSLSRLAVAAASEASPEDLNRQSPPTPRRRRGQLPLEWEALTTPVPEPPNYLLLAAGLSIVYFTRHAIAAELIQWWSIVAVLGLTVIRFTQRVLVALMLKAIQLVQGPLALVLTLVGWSGLFTRDMYTLIVNTTSIWPTLKALLLVTVVLSIGEVTRASAVSGQPWALLIATLLGMGAVSGVIHHTVFVLLLLLLVGFSLVVQKKDAISAVLPVTAVLVAVAEPSLKAVDLASFLALAVYNHYKNPEEQVELTASNRRIVQPVIIVVIALVLGVTAGSRYLRAWQLLWLAK